MYNSLIVTLIIKIWKFIVFEYNRSALSRILNFFKRSISYLSKGSRIKSIFTSRDSLIEKSIIYHLYSRLMKLLNELIEKIRMYIRKIGDYSLVYKNLQSLFCTKIEVLRTFFIFTLSFGLGLAVNNIIRGYYSGKSYLVSIVIVIGSIIGISLKENYKEILKSSLVYKFIYSIFSIEEGLTNVD